VRWWITPHIARDNEGVDNGKCGDFVEISLSDSTHSTSLYRVTLDRRDRPRLLSVYRGVSASLSIMVLSDGRPLAHQQIS
jgi:hypothetical protein